MTKVYFPREVFPFSAMLVWSWIRRRAEHSHRDDALLLDSAVRHRPVPSHSDRGAADIHRWIGACCSRRPTFTIATSSTLLDMLVTVWMFATPVVYPTQVTGTLGVVLQINPLAPIIDGYRAVLLRGELPNASPFAAAAALAVVLFAVGWLVFHRAEYTFAENA